MMNIKNDLIDDNTLSNNSPVLIFDESIITYIKHIIDELYKTMHSIWIHADNIEDKIRLMNIYKSLHDINHKMQII